MERPEHINEMLLEMEQSKNYKELIVKNPLMYHNGRQHPCNVERMFLGLKNAGYHRNMICIYTKSGYECFHKSALDKGIHGLGQSNIPRVSGSASRKKRQPCYFCGVESTGYSMIKRNGIEENLPTCSDHAV
jgi:hypothetical protein